MDRWVGRTVLVTGASSGIGEAISGELVRQGLKVVGVARSIDKLQTLSTELKDAKGQFIPRKCDVSKEEEIVDTFKWLEDNHGGVDVLINNAGISRRTRAIDADIATWKSIFDVNIFGLSVCSREAIKSMNSRGVSDGHIINMNSINGHNLPTMMSGCIYSISKHAVTLLSEQLRRELVDVGSKIKVTSISPGRVLTPIFETSNMQKMISHCPLLGPSAISEAVVYALSTPPDVQVTELTIRPVGDTLHKSPPEQL